jgi:O-antigen ligase
MDTFSLSRYLDRVVRFVSLGVVLLVPLAMPAFQPELDYAYGEYKSFILHLAVLIIAAGLTGSLIMAVVRKDDVFEGLKLTVFRLVRNPHHAPAHVLIAGMVGLVLAFLISTLMSPLPLVSFFGAYEEFSGTNSYDFVSFFIIFLAFALKFRNPSDLKLLLIVLCLGGTLVASYGLAQHFGWDGLGGRQHDVKGLYSRSPSSFGNSLNFSAFLVLTVIATLSIGVIRRQDRFVTFIVAVALGLQLAALWLGGARGAYIGTVIGITILIALVGLAYGWRGIFRALLVLSIGLVIAFVIASRPTTGYGGIDPMSKVISIGGQIESIIGSQNPEGQEGGLYTRSRIWATALKLLYDPAVPQDEPIVKTELRRFYGFGPDMFVHSYPIRVSPIGFLEIQPSAHNIILHILVTSGILGLIALIILVYGFLTILMNLVKRLKRDSDIQPELILAVAFLTIALGKVIEMQTGVSRVSDLAPTFAVLGALVSSVSLIKYQVDSTNQINKSDSQLFVWPNWFRTGWILVGVAIFGVALLIVTFVGWDLRRINASAAIYDVSQSEDPVVAGQQFLEANRRAPERQDVAYRIYETYVDEAWTARKNGQLEQATFLMMSAREVWLPLEARNPYELGAQLALATISATLVSWGHVEFIDEMRFRYSKIAHLNPGLPILIGTSSTALASIGDYESAIRLAEQVIATEEQTHGWSKAWYAKGASKFLLGYEKEGIADLLIATEKQPGSEGARAAHSTLGRIYRDRGDIESAEFHEQMASR